MRYLFYPLGRQRLERLDLKRTLLALDFDGTLAPLASTPDGAHLALKSRRLLEELQRRGAFLAVISGRSVKDLRPRLGFRADALIGNHGIEGLASAAEIRRAAQIVQLWKRQLSVGLRPSSGVFLEDKRFSLSFHYRLARDKLAARRHLLEQLRRLHPRPRIVGGKFVFNALPEGFCHKGQALRALMRRTGYRSALYVGDDDTDEDVFALAGRSILTVRVGEKKTSRAKFYLRGQEEVAELLTLLLG